MEDWKEKVKDGFLLPGSSLNLQNWKRTFVYGALNGFLSFVLLFLSTGQVVSLRLVLSGTPLKDFHQNEDPGHSTNIIYCKTLAPNTLGEAGRWSERLWEVRDGYFKSFISL